MSLFGARGADRGSGWNVDTTIMDIFEVLHYGNPGLREVSRVLDTLTPEDDQLIDRMIETMYELNGIGLAAPQVGVLKCIFVADVDLVDPESKRNPVVFINPEIVEESDEDSSSKEGCLSLPDIEGDVFRPSQIIVKARDREFKPVRIEADNLLARVIQHELDHLKGVLFIDRMSKIKRTLIAVKIGYLRRKTEKELKR